MNDEIFLNERLEVLAVFAPGQERDICRPVKFRRSSGREVVISEIGLVFPANNRGSQTVHVFDVTDGGTDYRLEFDAQRLTWHLTREADHYV